MSEKLPPWSWARAVSAYSGDRHEKRVNRCVSIEHLREAARWEAEAHQEPSKAKLARINQRIQEVQSG